MNEENTISIDLEKCIGCFICVNDCVSANLYILDRKPKIHEVGCIECGHCFAICPQNAIRMNNFDTSDCFPVVSMTEFDSEKLLRAMKSRRTIRQFKNIKVEQDKLEKILEAGRFCPTASNSQNVSYIILNNKQNDIEKECVRIFKRVQKIASPFVKSVNNIIISENFFFKGAPLVIIVLSKSNINAGLASSYMEIMAESLGLGVLYSGYFVICSKISPKIKRMLELPKEHKIVSCMVIGYPNVQYKRTVPRKKLQTVIL